MTELLRDLRDLSLPDGFEYPPEFCRAVSYGLTDLEPWFVLPADAVRERAEGMRRRYPGARYWPFARRQDNDDVACWEPPGRAVLIVHDFASPGWERRGRFEGFDDWLRHAVEEFIDWGREEIAYYDGSATAHPWG